MSLKSLCAAALLAIISLTSCSDSKKDDNGGGSTPSAVTFVVSPETVEAPAAGGTFAVKVKASESWSITSAVDWITVTPSGGLKDQEIEVSVNVKKFSDMEPRTAELTVRSNNGKKTIPVVQKPDYQLTVANSSYTVGGQAHTSAISIVSNADWTASSNAGWLTVKPASGHGSAEVAITVTENTGNDDRVGTVTFAYDGGKADVVITQLSDAVVAPEGYHLVWADEFNDPNVTTPDTKKWWYEIWPSHYVNNELQRYIKSPETAYIENGILHIVAKKINGEVCSARINTVQGWTYGYFEARLWLPKGKGTWPAFWMMPVAGGTWPDCGEIDIMEEVGVNPNYTSSSIHCAAYNHPHNTQKTAERLTPGAEDGFHVYALEWTPDYIRSFVDGKQLLYFANDKKGDKKTWPFTQDFNLKLNLAWGGDWGGWNGVNEAALPCTYRIDYVRVFQK